MNFLLQPETYISLLTLTLLEIVLGIDNIIFISIVTNKLPADRQKRVRTTGLLLALAFRICLLALLTAIMGLIRPLITVGSFAFSARDLILLLGGIFLITKSITEIHGKVEGEEHGEAGSGSKATYYVLMQIVALDIIFSFDSILTAIGLSNQLAIMITAVVISMVIMIYFSGFISAFINKHPTLQVLALSFLILIGFMLALEAFHYEIPKGYIYFALFFSMIVEMINLRIRKKAVGRSTTTKN
ncbi:MAG TPA: TerC family protein [Williamwhitmania sp.]|nr:TerC family protein [Williamwhitmania sp.]